MTPGRAAVVGIGLIGGSIGLALRSRGWRVTGRDHDLDRMDAALDRGVVDAVGVDPDAEITFVATPVGQIIDEVEQALADSPGIVTDVGGVKAPIMTGVRSSRFVGGHPMAGSELDGLDGADGDLFRGATWVLTPDDTTADPSLAGVRRVVSELGAEAIVLSPERHDALVAMVSHVPHLTAAALMRLADSRAAEHAALLRLAAGGFRDMTRIAAGQPSIWPDVCAENREAIVQTLDELVGELVAMRELVAEGDRSQLLDRLTVARAARRNLPSRVVRPELISEVRIPVADRPGELAHITSRAAELGVSIADLEIAHSAEGEQGVVIVLVERTSAAGFAAALAEDGYRPVVSDLT